MSILTNNTFNSLIDVLMARAAQTPDKECIRFLPNGNEDGALSWSYKTLDLKSRSIAAAIEKTDLVCERPIPLLLSPGEEFVAGFFGCLYAGAIALPMAPPGLARLARSFSRLTRLIEDSKARLVLSSGRLIKAVKKVSEQVDFLGQAQILNIDDIDLSLADFWQRPKINSETLAWLQYTSGATNEPKGVMVSHGNIVSNLESIIETMSIRGVSSILSWLPPFHDMGLVGGILAPIYLGALCLIMPPMAFLRRPANWLEAVSRYQAQATGGPNFAFEACVKKITDEQMASIDLSSLKVLFCGAEPIRWETVKRFVERFEKASLKREAFYPCYGLAENTLFVSGVKPFSGASVLELDANAYAEGRVRLASQESETIERLVSCGRAGYLNEIRVINPKTQLELSEGQIGEIWLRGPCVAKGYWEKPKQSEEFFKAFEASSGAGPFFRTGDLGFIFEGELYISGREKEMIIIGGRNFFPHDLEICALESSEGLIENGAAAFGLDSGSTEELVVALETRLPHDALNETIANVLRSFSEQFDLIPKAIALVRRNVLPKTTSGKIQRRLCRKMFLEGSLPILKLWQEAKIKAQIPVWGPPPPDCKDETIWERYLARGIATKLNLEADQIDPALPFSSFGLNSSAAVAISGELQEALGKSLEASLLYDYGNIASLARYLAGRQSAAQNLWLKKPKKEPIAIIGASLRAPGADSIEAFSQMLFNGIDAITRAPSDRLKGDNQSTENQTYPRFGGFLSGALNFDPAPFKISPREAEEMDPQQRLLLEVSWEALERAIIDPLSLKGSKTGVFVGISAADYQQMRLNSNKPLNVYVGTGSAHSLAANRLSYVLGLRGPSLSLDSACSSSLTALHLACRSLNQGESDLALACGVNLILDQRGSIIFNQGAFLAPDGRCKSFSDDADGYVRSEGCLVVVLKTLSRAQEDGDHILALVKGSAINQDGQTNGLTAPSREAQRELIIEALADASLNPSDIDYLEAHGTGTNLGDPIEFGALSQVFSGTRNNGEPLIISSVKTNIGHLEAAAGLAGVVKTLCALEKKAAPPHLHLRKINPAIDLSSIPAVIPTQTLPWPRKKNRARRAGVSSFGFGGANAHAIIEEWPPEENGEAQSEFKISSSDFPVFSLITLSAMTQQRLEKLAELYAKDLEKLTPSEIADFAYTTNVGRASLPWRLCVNYDENLTKNLKNIAKNNEPGLVNQVKPSQARNEFVFNLPETITVSPKAIERLSQSFPAFDESFQKVVLALNEVGLKDILSEEILSNLDPQSRLASSFALQYALSNLWQSFGITPSALSFNKRALFVSCVISGTISVQDAVNLLAAALEKNEKCGHEAFTQLFNQISPQPPNHKLLLAYSVEEIEWPKLTSLKFWLDTIFTFSQESSQDPNQNLSQPNLNIIHKFGDVLDMNDRFWAGTSAKPNQSLVYPAFCSSSDTRANILSTLGTMWLRGAKIEWKKVYQGSKLSKRIIPTYPFEERRYWFEAIETNSYTKNNLTHNEEKISQSISQENILSSSEINLTTQKDRNSYSSETIKTKDFLLDQPGHLKFIKEQIRSVLRLKDDNNLDEGLSLINAGFDSLMFVELASKIKRLSSVEISPELFVQGISIGQLAALLEPGSQESQRAEEISLLFGPDPQNRFAPFPLTDTQYAYWVGRDHGFTLGGVSCGSYLEVEINNLNVERLTMAVNRLIARHDMLRATIADGVQRAAPMVEWYQAQEDDLSNLSQIAKEAALQKKREARSHLVLPLDRAPLFELTLSKVSEKTYRLHFNFDLLIADAWSFGLLARDLMDFYLDPKLEKPSPSFSFRDYVLADLEEKKSPAYARDLEYWLRRLDSLPPGPELPLAKKPEQIGTPRFFRREAKLKAEKWSKLKNKARSLNLTPSSLLLAAFSLALARWSASSRFCLMLTTFSRKNYHKDVNEIVGDFTSLLLLEVESQVNLNFTQHAQNVARQLGRDMARNRVSGLEVLRELSKREKGESVSRSSVVFTSALPLSEGSEIDFFAPLEAVNPKLTYAISQTPQVWLDHQVCQYQGGLIYTWDAVDELFPPNLLDDLFISYKNFLESLVNSQEAWDEPCPLATLPERQAQIRAKANDVFVLRESSVLHQEFLNRADENKDNIALIDDKDSLSYGELEKISLVCSIWLRENEQKNSDITAIFMDKGWEQAAAALAISRSGGAYLPIDPLLPPKRVEYLLSDASVKIALTQPHLKERSASLGVKTLIVSRELLNSPTGEFSQIVSPNSLAYVVYTSGSTGLPKGVMIKHEAAHNTIDDLIERLNFSSSDRVFGISSLSFDLSVFDIFGLLSVGGAIIYPSADDIRNPNQWMRLIIKHQATIWNSTPSLMSMLLDYLVDNPLSNLAKLRLVMLSGDWIPTNMPARLKSVFDGVTVAALGGATEASIWSNIYMANDIPEEFKSVPYGWPLSNQGYRVLDEELRHRPDYVPGNLYITGKGLAEGYLNDEEKTRSSFIVAPKTGERMYKTGDLGRYWDDGTLEFLGRNDNQVKLNGYRIELGEIEAAMTACPSVNQAAAIIMREGDESARLVGFVTSTKANLADDLKEEEHREAMLAEGISQISAVERLKYKQERHNLRCDLEGFERIELFSQSLSEQEELVRYFSRLSSRKFVEKKAPFESFSRLLSELRALDKANWPLARFRYASAGWTYPVQIYLLIKPDKVEDIEAGSYYYDPFKNNLVKLAPYPQSINPFPGANGRIFEGASFAIFLVSETKAIEPLYGNRSKDFELIEAGLVSQLLESACRKLNLGLCQIGAVNFNLLRDLFLLNKDHRYLHCLVGGVIKGQDNINLIEANNESMPEEINNISNDLPKIIKEALSAHLPSYMPPSTIIELKAMPLTSNGKVDRNELIKIARERADQNQFVTPRGERETKVAKLVSDALGGRTVGALDNFFELGATSLHLVNLQRRLNQAFEKEINIADIFSNPNVASLSAFLEGSEHEDELLSGAEKRAKLRRELHSQRA
ncbi:MAG: amino acid adenylation domain-containing protein [Deltaproteobacteria bacterium]|jgi:amino acid adenylation domain-containing protein|nr:amino acid adenylation domain-containing protein [Deltaproteobacteria bacterium]